MPHPFDNPETLLRERQWLRGFARALVRDASTADDLTQDVLLAALHDGGAYGRGRRPWLARVTRNLAARRVRREAQRASRERAAARAEPLPSAAAVVERLHAEQALVRALLALAEPYRYVVVLRFWEGLPPRAIAARLGLPVETVRTRLKRALAQLRGALDRAHGGDRRAWALPLLGGSALHAKSSVLSAVGALLALAGSAPLWWPAPEPAPRVERDAMPRGSIAGATTAPEEPQAPAVVMARAALPAPAPPQFELKGRCVDEQGVPLAGCSAALFGSRRDRQELANYELEQGKVEWSDPPLQTTSSDGRFAFTFVPPAPFRFQLRLERPDRVPQIGYFRELPLHGTKDLGDITLTNGHLVRGIVVDTRGEPQPDAEVWIDQSPKLGLRPTPAPPPEPSPEVVPLRNYQARTDREGAFAFAAPVRPGTWNLQINRRQLVSPAQIEVTADRRQQRFEIRVQALTEATAITGIVVDEGGMPVSDAEISNEYDYLRTRSDRDGWFRLERETPDRDPGNAGRQRLTATAQDYDITTLGEPVAWGTGDVRLVLRHGAQLEVRVRDSETGAPIEEFGVRLFPRPFATARPGRHRGALSYVDRHADGVVCISGVLRAPHLLIVEPRGEHWSPSGAIVVDAADHMPTVEVGLSPPATRKLRIVRADDTPIAGAKVELLAPFGEPVDQETLAVEIDRLIHTSAPHLAWSLQRATTDASGEVELRGPAATPLAVRLPGPGHVPTVEQPITLARDAAPLVVRVAAGATVRGRIGPAEVLAMMWPSDEALAANPERRQQIVPGAFLQVIGGSPHDTFPRRRHEERFPIDALGRFSITGIPPGAWDLFALWSEAHPPHGWGSTSDFALRLGPLRDGEVREVDVDLRRLLKAHIAGTVRYNGDAAPAGTWVSLQGEAPDGRGGTKSTSAQQTPLAAGGTFAFDVPAGSYYACLHWNGNFSLPGEQVISVAPNERRTDLAVDVAGCSLRLRVAGRDDRPRAGVFLSASSIDRKWQRSLGTTADDGTLVFDPVPVGRLQIRAFPKHLLDPAAQQALRAAHPDDPQVVERALIELGTVDVGPGPTTTIDLRLPASAGYD